MGHPSKTSGQNGRGVWIAIYFGPDFTAKVDDLGRWGGGRPSTERPEKNIFLARKNFFWQEKIFFWCFGSPYWSPTPPPPWIAIYWQSSSQLLPPIIVLDWGYCIIVLGDFLQNCFISLFIVVTRGCLHCIINFGNCWFFSRPTYC